MSTQFSLLKLNDDCLFVLFEKLNFSQLLVIADTCSKFKLKARSYFEHTLQSSSSFSFKQLRQIEVIRLFRLFGDFFNRVDSTDFNIDQNQSLFQNKFIALILRYCSELINFKLHRFSSVNQNVIQIIASNSTTLQSIEFNFCSFLGGGQVNEIFPVHCPVLHAFTLKSVYYGYHPYDAVKKFTLNRHFPKLMHLAIRNVDVVDMREFFEKNQQLITYSEEFCAMPDRHLQYIVQYLPSIQSITLSCERTNIIFANMTALRALHTISMKSLSRSAVILGDLESISLQNLYLHQFVLNFQNTNICKFINLKTLTLDKCTIDNEYFIEICKRCKEITYINVCTSSVNLSMDQLVELLRTGNLIKLEKLVLPDSIFVQPISYVNFECLAHSAKNRHSKISICIATLVEDWIGITFTNSKIDVQYTMLHEDEEPTID